MTLRSRFVSSLALLLGSLWLATCAARPANGPIAASGFIEGDEVAIASAIGGRVTEVLVEEGDEVATGQVLIRLDDALLQTQRAEALAAVAAAEANLARVQAGARPAEREAARAALAQAEAERDGALRALEHARRALSDPQELDAEIAQAQTDVALAEQELEMARADLNQTEMLYNVYKDQGGDTERTWSLNLQAAQAAVEAAQARLDGARRYLNALHAIRARPLALQAQVHAAEMAVQATEAAVAAAQAEVDKAEAGPTPQELHLAQAQLHQAQAALGLVDAQLAQLTLTAPISGTVTGRAIHAGETATAGGTLLTLANLNQVTLVLYVPESRIGQVQVGQPVEVTVDSFPGRTFIGRVATIAREAEFTPRNVQTQEERVNLVFAVKVVLPNPDHALRPGMPADAVIRPAS